MDDEVRDRSSFVLSIMDDPQLCQQYIIDDSVYSWESLEQSLVYYCGNPQLHLTPFDITVVSVVSNQQENQKVIGYSFIYFRCERCGYAGCNRSYCIA